MTLKTAPILLLAALLIGCKSGDSSATTADTTKPPAAADAGTTTPKDDSTTKSVVGTWTNDDKDMTNSTIEFKDDGTVNMHGDVAKAKGVTGDATATYKLDGDTMTTQITSMKMTAGSDADAASKKEADDANKAATPEAFKSVPPDVDTIAWKDKDTFTLTNKKSNKVVTFTRKA